MKCPECQFENPDGVNFCVECGSKLEKICPKCGYPNSLSHKFCGGCGHKLSLPEEALPKDLSFDEKLTKIQRYLPKGLTKKILSQRDRIEGERKQVTVMFCDMEGYSQLSEMLGAEEAYGIMDQIYEILIHKVHDYEGTVNELTGDGIMALFGAPIALEDAPQRAIRSAMAIQREMTRFSDKIKETTKGLPAIKMRVGIHTGPVVVGTLGNDLRVEFKAVGETVNLASRMEGIAEPGATYVTEDTFKLTEGFFRFEALGKRKVKGKKEPINVYRAIAPSTRRTRFDVSAERGLTPFVGREREIELLLDAFDRAKAGRGQAISIMSEAGVGKSRLLYEFRKAVANEDVTFLEGKCLSYSRGVAYHPMIDILKANFDVLEGDGNTKIRKKVKRGLKTLGLDEALTLPYFLELLSVKDSGIDKMPMSPEAKKDRIMEALKKIVLKGSEIRPLILALEDLHWVDKTSEEAVKNISESIPAARVLILLTYRPEFVHTWGGKSFHSQITLNRLSNREILIMMSHLLGTVNIESDLEELILEKTEGVPFFVEEFIRSLKDLKMIERSDREYYLAKDIQDVAIPSTIQDVIMARVDSLDEKVKELLQTGAVIEREFSYELIKQVTGLPEQELLSRLSILKDSELLYERGIYPQSNYIFKHALTQEVVYDSILIKKRKKLHKQIGIAMERLFEENISEYYTQLAEHYFEAEEYIKAAKYSKLVGKRAGQTGSINEAIVYAKKTISSLERLPMTEDLKKQVIDARTIMGLRMIEMNYFPEAREAIEPIIKIAFKSNYENRISQILTILGGCEYSIDENLPKAFEHFEKALKVSEKIGDIETQSMVRFWLGYGLSLNNEFERALHHLENSLSIQEKAHNPVWISTVKSLSGYLGYYYWGKIDQAYRVGLDSIPIAEKSDDIYSKVFAYSAHGVHCFGKGYFKEAINYLSKGLEVCSKIRHHYWDSTCNQFLGEAYFEVKEYHKSIEHYENAVLIMDKNRILPSVTKLNKIGVARAKVMANEKDIDLTSLFGYARENKLKRCQGWMMKHLAGILLNIDDDHVLEAEDCIKKAIKADIRNEMKFHVGRDYALYAELHKRKGDKPRAKESLSKAIAIFKECGADGWVQKYEKELAEI